MREVVIWGLIGFAVLSVASGLFSVRKTLTARDFFLLDGKLNLGSFVGTMTATNLSLGNMIFVCAIWGYLYSWSGVFWVAVCIILLFLGFRLMRSRFTTYIVDRTNDGSLHDYLSRLFIATGDARESIRLRLTASLITVLCLVLALVLELHLCAVLVSKLFSFDLTSTFVALTLLIAVYTATGGFRSVVHTDILQAVLVFAGIIAGIYFVMSSTFGQIKSTPTLGPMLQDVGWANALGISFLGLGWLLVTMDTWQRNCASRNAEVTKVGITVSSILLVASVVSFGSLGVYVKEVIDPFVTAAGNAAQLSSGTYPFNDFFLLEQYATPSIRFALGIVFLGLIMAALSTADTFLVVLSHSLTTDVVLLKMFGQGIGSLEPKEQRLFAQIGRMVVVAMSVIVCVIWWTMNALGLLFDPLTLFFVFYSVQFALLSPILIGNFYKRKDAALARLSILISAAFGLTIGLFLLERLAAGDQTTYLRLRPDQWLALLPLIVAFSSCITYFVCIPFNKPRVRSAV